MKFEYVFWVVFLGVVIHLGWKFLRSGGSIAGALLGGRVRREVGEIVLSQGSFSSQVLRVLDMEAPDGERFVALSVVAKAPLAASVMPFRLSQDQSQELVAMLLRASDGQ